MEQIKNCGFHRINQQIQKMALNPKTAKFGTGRPFYLEMVDRKTFPTGFLINLNKSVNKKHEFFI